MRVRQFVQDDAHIFCREDQIVDEVALFCDLLDTVYKDLGFDHYAIKLALRPDKRFGSEAMWDWSEASLRNAVRATGRDTPEFGWEELPGEGAFYAPKLEFHLTDAIGRTWQVGTIQTDTVLPERLDASYVAEDGAKHRPIMLHRAILGSFERFIGILIEHYAGKFPLWLAPVQAVVATIVSDADDYAREVLSALSSAGLRVEADLRNEKINYKVREHSLAKVSHLLVVGKREADERTVAIRTLGSEGQRIVPLAEAVAMLASEARPPGSARPLTQILRHLGRAQQRFDQAALVETFVRHKFKLGRIFVVHPPRDLVLEISGVGAQRLDDGLLIFAEQRLHEHRRVAQVGRHPHFGDAHDMAAEHLVMNIPARKNIGQRMTHRLADA